MTNELTPSHGPQDASYLTQAVDVQDAQQAHSQPPRSERVAVQRPRRRSRPTVRSLSSLLESELGHLLEAIPDGVVIADDAGHIHLVNSQAEALFGYDHTALLGQPIEILMPERFRSVHPTFRAHYTAAPHQRPMGTGLQLYGLRPDGTEFPVEISLSPIMVRGTPLVLSTIRDVTERRLLEQRAREAMEARLVMLQAVLNELPCGVYLARGFDAELVLANAQVAGVWGAAWSENQPMATFLAASGTRVFDMQGRELAADQLATARALRTGVSVRQHQEVIRHADGSVLTVLVNAISLDPTVFPYLSGVHVDPERPTPLALVVHEDVSALKDAERLKDEFITLAAHELRNPVASLTGYAHMLVRAVSDTRRKDPSLESSAAQEPDRNEAQPIPLEWQEEAATAVMQASHRLAALTEDLLDATRLHANRLTLRSEPTELGALVRRVVKRMRVTTEQHALHVIVPDEPIVVEVDVQRVEQVLTNLIANAVKYSPGGGDIDVMAAVAGGTEGVAIDAASPASAVTDTSNTPTRTVRVSVRDQGIGIPPHQQARIFDRFMRADNAQQRGIAGTGLGLYLCRELVERQGGRIWFESVEGSGTTFTIELPIWSEPDELSQEHQKSPQT